jgi:hypothetical protein
VRPLRVVQKNKGMSLLVKSLYYSIPDVSSIFSFSILALTMITVNVVGFMKGRMNECLTSHMTSAEFELVVTAWDCADLGGDWV